MMLFNWFAIGFVSVDHLEPASDSPARLLVNISKRFHIQLIAVGVLRVSAIYELTHKDPYW